MRPEISHFNSPLSDADGPQSHSEYQSLRGSVPAMWETWAGSPGWEDPLEEGMATHSSVLAWRIPMDRGAWRATVQGVTKTERLSTEALLKFVFNCVQQCWKTTAN